ncbi:MAG: MATE family efflux transporter [Ruminococcaceae bacterium]|nr:MATE family efflux transporter [Oscillospiraceae bacterium]
MLFSNKDLRRLILPLIVEQILAISVGMVDTMMISHEGDAAISGVSLVDMVNHLLITVLAAVSTGGAVIVSQYIGHRDRDAANRAAGQLITVTTLISVGIAGLCLILCRPLLSLLFGAIEPDVMESAVIYFRISALSYPFLAVYNSCAALFRSMGNSRISMVVSTGMNITNAIGNAWLIFGLDMGVAGAAYASLFSRAMAAVVMFVLLLPEKNHVFLQAGTIFRWEWQLVKKILYIACPSGIENGIFQLGRVLVVSIIAGFGTTQIAANAVANNLDAMGCIAGQAMNLAMITVVGQCLGAGDTDQAEFFAKKMMKITYAATAAVNIIIFSNLFWILNIYDLSDEARSLALLLICIHNGFAVFLWPASFTLPNVLRAGGDVRFPMVISVTSMIVFRILFSLILGVGCSLGAIGVWIAMVLDWIFRSTNFYIRFRRGKWKTIKVI